MIPSTDASKVNTGEATFALMRFIQHEYYWGSKGTVKTFWVQEYHTLNCCACSVCMTSTGCVALADEEEAMACGAGLADALVPACTARPVRLAASFALGWGAATNFFGVQKPECLGAAFCGAFDSRHKNCLLGNGGYVSVGWDCPLIAQCHRYHHPPQWGWASRRHPMWTANCASGAHLPLQWVVWAVPVFGVAKPWG